MRSRGTGGRRGAGRSRRERGPSGEAAEGRPSRSDGGGSGTRHRAESGRRSRRWGKADDYEQRRIQWAALALRLDGRFTEAPKPLQDTICCPHGNWEITVDTDVQSDGNSAVFYTRVQAPFLARDDFTLRVSRAGLGSRMLGWIGFRGVRIGDPRLDAAYVIRGRNVGRVRSFFLDGRLRAVLLEQDSCRMEIRDLPWRERRRHRGRVRMVRIRMKGEFLDPERVLSLVELCKVTLDRLASAGVASLSAVESAKDD